MVHDAASAFGGIATEYDGWVRQAIPAYDELYRVATEVIPFPGEAAIRVCDLGAGSGLFAERVSRLYPAARFDLVDASREMLNQARKRFRSQSDRFRYHEASLEAFAPEEPHDLVLSSLAIHHLEDLDKQALFARVFGSLRAGGAFVNVDQVRGPGRFADLYWSV